MTRNFGKGLTRTWITAIGLVELLICGVVIYRALIWYSENPFDQFDSDYISLWQRLDLLVIAMPVTLLAGFVIWLVAR